MELTITLRKTVEDEATGQVIFETVKTKLADHPDVTITGHLTSRFDMQEDPE